MNRFIHRLRKIKLRLKWLLLKSKKYRTKYKPFQNILIPLFVTITLMKFPNYKTLVQETLIASITNSSTPSIIMMQMPKYKFTKLIKRIEPRRCKFLQLTSLIRKIIIIAHRKRIYFQINKKIRRSKRMSRRNKHLKFIIPSNLISKCFSKFQAAWIM